MGISVLHPKERKGANEFYEGTADAIWKNLDFIEPYSPKNIIVLAGDHVYKMDYDQMLRAHENSGAAVTIAATTVPFYEAPRFGIMDIDENYRIIGFEEKPKNPKSNLASMGVYVFDWSKLKHQLLMSGRNPKSGMDIGKGIIPQMLTSGERMSAYLFGGYWRDVGNVHSLWEANMDLLSPHPGINLGDGCDIVSRDRGTLLYHERSYSGYGQAVNSLVTKGCVNRGKIMKSVISADVEIGEDATVVDSVIMPGVKIGRGSFIHKSIIGSGAIVEEYTAIGGLKPDGEHLDNCQGINVVGNNTYLYTHTDGKLNFAPLFPEMEAAYAM